MYNVRCPPMWVPGLVPGTGMGMVMSLCYWPPPQSQRHSLMSDEDESQPGSEADFDAMDERRSLIKLKRSDMIKVLEYVDPHVFYCVRLAQHSDMELKKLCYLVSPNLCTRTVRELGLTTMAGFKRMMKAASVDNGKLEKLVSDGFTNLDELAREEGWEDAFGESSCNLEVRLHIPVVGEVPEPYSFENIGNW